MAVATPATTRLHQLGVSFSVHQYRHDPRAQSYGAEAATALDVDPARVFKTLIVADGRDLACAVIPVTSQLDLKAMSAAVGRKRVTIADPKDAERATGFVVGGISPVGQKGSRPIVVDESALGFATVFVSGGRRGLEIELSAADLLSAAPATTAHLIAE